LLLHLLENTPHSRVITVASERHFKSEPLNFDRLDESKYFDTQGSYAASKLANVLFAQEL
jgi:NAD(P)-dependent dehydrogenase (short-subunit alcohol dehydrogenase family)